MNQKIERIGEFLDSKLGCSSVIPNYNKWLFNYIERGNRGCYISIGGYEFRCHLKDETVYLQAVRLYLSLEIPQEIPQDSRFVG